MATGIAIGSLAERAEDPATNSAAAVTARLLDPSFKFPTLPAIAAEIMNLANAADVNFRAVDRLVRRDPILAARVLAVANSPMFRQKQAITSLRTAMMTMGWTVVREILWQVLAESHVFRGGRRRQFASLRQHAVGVAHITRAICRRVSCDSEFSFVCGLLHDIGRPLCLQVFSSNPELRPDPAEHTDTLDALHTVIGERIAQAWNLPDLVGLTARHHHDFDGGVIVLEQRSKMPQIVAAAERIADHHGIGRAEVPVNPEDAPVLEGLGLEPEAIVELIQETVELRCQVG